MVRKLLRIQKVFSIRFVSFHLTFFCALGAVYLWANCSQNVENVSKLNKQTRLLNVKIYQRNPKEKCVPDPLILLVRLDKNKRFSLNSEEYNLENTVSFEKRLSQVFKDREAYGVYNEEGTQIEKRVFIMLDDSAEYGDLIKIVDALNRAGASPIYIDPFNEKYTYALGAS